MDKVTRQHNRVTRVDGFGLSESPHGGYSGTVRTPWGYVEVFADEGWTSEYNGKRYPPRAGFCFIWRGIEYSKWVTRDHLDREYTKQGLATMAGRFARSIADPPIYAAKLPFEEAYEGNNWEVSLGTPCR